MTEMGHLHLLMLEHLIAFDKMSCVICGLVNSLKRCLPCGADSYCSSVKCEDELHSPVVEQVE